MTTRFQILCQHQIRFTNVKVIEILPNPESYDMAIFSEQIACYSKFRWQFDHINNLINLITEVEINPEIKHDHYSRD